MKETCKANNVSYYYEIPVAFGWKPVSMVLWLRMYPTNFGWEMLQSNVIGTWKSSIYLVSTH